MHCCASASMRPATSPASRRRARWIAGRRNADRAPAGAHRGRDFDAVAAGPVRRRAAGPRGRRARQHSRTGCGTHSRSPASRTSWQSRACTSRVARSWCWRCCGSRGALPSLRPPAARASSSRACSWSGVTGGLCLAFGRLAPGTAHAGDGRVLRLAALASPLLAVRAGARLRRSRAGRHGPGCPHFGRLLAVVRRNRGPVRRWCARTAAGAEMLALCARAQLSITALLTPVLAASLRAHLAGRAARQCLRDSRFQRLVLLPAVLAGTALAAIAPAATAGLWRALAAILDHAWPLSRPWRPGQAPAGRPRHSRVPLAGSRRRPRVRGAPRADCGIAPRRGGVAARDHLRPAGETGSRRIFTGRRRRRAGTRGRRRNGASRARLRHRTALARRTAGGAGFAAAVPARTRHSRHRPARREPRRPGSCRRRRTPAARTAHRGAR